MGDLTIEPWPISMKALRAFTVFDMSDGLDVQ